MRRTPDEERAFQKTLESDRFQKRVFEYATRIEAIENASSLEELKSAILDWIVNETSMEQ